MQLNSLLKQDGLAGNSPVAMLFLELSTEVF